VLEESTGSVRTAWAWVFVPPAVLLALAALYHAITLPRPAADRPMTAQASVGEDWLATFVAFFRRPGIGIIIAFLLLYRLGESQLVAVARLFLLDERGAGGLGLTTKEVGLVYGTYGVVALTLGGILGGLAIARWGLRRLLWPMLLCMHVPNLAYVWLAVAQPAATSLISAAVVVEQAGYGFGFTAYMVYMMLVADGPHKTAHYAICTGFMAAGTRGFLCGSA